MFRALVIALCVTASASAQFAPFAFWRLTASGPVLAIDTSNIAAHWAFDSNKNDTTYRASTLTNANTPVFTNSSGGASLHATSLDGTCWWYRASDSVTALADRSWTITAWIYPADTSVVSGNEHMVFAKDYSGARQYYLGFAEGSNISKPPGYSMFSELFKPASVVQLTMRTVGMALNAWHFVALGHNAASDSAYIILDTQMLYVATGGALQADAGREFRIGAREYSSFTNPYKGRIDEVTIWKKYLTPTELQYLRNAGTARRWPFL